jgi:hypothetical protein
MIIMTMMIVCEDGDHCDDDDNCRDDGYRGNDDYGEHDGGRAMKTN